MFIRLIYTLKKPKPLLILFILVLFIIAILFPWSLIPLQFYIVLFHLFKYTLVSIGLRLSLPFKNMLFYSFLFFSSIVLTTYDTLSYIQFKNDKILLSDLSGVHSLVRNSTHSKPKYFLAANLFNNHDILPLFMREIERFIELVGRDNIIISIIEDHSKDDTPELLKRWDIKLKKMKVKTFIKTNYTMSDPDSEDRIVRMAKIRNAPLKPLASISQELDSNPYHRILFLNDIIFFMEDLVALINTNGNEYDLTCACDYEGLGLYDLWVTRDNEGKQVSPIYPHFQKETDRNLFYEDKPIPVYSCWNGAIVINWSRFKERPVSFRSQKNPKECYSSECFYFVHDMRYFEQSRYNGKLNVFMNPKVRVGYQYRYYFLWKELLNWTIAKFFLRWIINREVGMYGFTNNHTLSYIYQCTKF